MQSKSQQAFFPGELPVVLVYLTACDCSTTVRDIFTFIGIKGG